MDREPTNGQVAVAATLLALALGAFLAALFLPTSCLGQCGPGGCAPAFRPAPMHYPAPVYLPPTFASQTPAPAQPAAARGDWYVYRIDRGAGAKWEVTQYGDPSYPRYAARADAQAEADRRNAGCGCSSACTCGCNEGRPCGCATITADGRRIVPSGQKVAEKTGGAPRDTAEPTQNFGLDLSKLSGEKKYILNGKEVTRDQAVRVIEEGPGIPDESHLMRLVVIGPEADRKRVLDDLDRTPAMAKLKDKLLVQAYDANDPIIKRRGYVTEGSPSITLVAPTGQVLARNKDGQYKGAQALAAGIFAAGKPYLPQNDPDLAPPKAANPLDLLKDVPPWGWGVGGVLLAMFLMRREPAK